MRVCVCNHNHCTIVKTQNIPCYNLLVGYTLKKSLDTIIFSNTHLEPLHYNFEYFVLVLTFIKPAHWMPYISWIKKYHIFHFSTITLYYWSLSKFIIAVSAFCSIYLGR